MAKELSNLSPKAGSRRKAMRVGRGEGSGKGKTAGRGMKGQRARGTVPIGFEGGQMPLHRRLPKKGFKNIHATRYIEIGLDRIEEKFNAGDVVDIRSLKAAGVISSKIEKETKNGTALVKDARIKILGNGDLTKAVTIVAEKFTKGALAKIEAAGGTATVVGE
jgi:large subunit ribosomal protein L15